MPAVVLPPRLCLGLDLVQRAGEIGQPVKAWVVPDRGQQVARGEQAIGGDARHGAARQRILVVRQAPAGIEGLAEEPRTVPGQQRLVAELGADGIDGAGIADERPGGHGRVADGLARAQVGGGQVARAQAGRGFGMGADHDAGAGMFIAGRLQHLQEPRPARAPQRGVAGGLVHDQHVAGRRRRRVGQVGVVLGQVRRAQGGNRQRRVGFPRGGAR